MTPARLAARCVELLGTVDGPVAVVAPRGVVAAVGERVRVAGADDGASAAVCVFLGEPIDRAARAATVQGLAARLAAGAPLVVVDHNQPRPRWRRLAGIGVAGAARPGTGARAPPGGP